MDSVNLIPGGERRKMADDNATAVVFCVPLGAIIARAPPGGGIIHQRVERHSERSCERLSESSAAVNRCGGRAAGEGAERMPAALCRLQSPASRLHSATASICLHDCRLTPRFLHRIWIFNLFLFPRADSSSIAFGRSPPTLYSHVALNFPSPL